MFAVLLSCRFQKGLPRWCSGKESTCWCRRCRFNPWLGKIPWRRKWQPTPVNGNPLQYCCLENSMDRGARYGATVHVVAKSWTWLSTQACRLQRECIVNWTGYKNNFFIACWCFRVLIMNVLWVKIWFMVCQCKYGLIIDAMSRCWRQFVYKKQNWHPLMTFKNIISYSFFCINMRLSMNSKLGYLLVNFFWNQFLKSVYLLFLL